MKRRRVEDEDRRETRAGEKAPPRGRLDWRSGYTWAAAVFLIVVFFGLYPKPLVGILVGVVFLFLGVRILFTLLGPYDEAQPWQVPVQGAGRIAVGALLIFCGSLALLPAISDLRPALVWEHPRFGDLRTLFWGHDAYAAFACDAAEHGPPAKLRYAVERLEASSPVSCPGFGSERLSLLETAEGDEEIAIVLRSRRYVREDLDRKLHALAWQDRRPAIESLVAAGANPNAMIEGNTALGVALDNTRTALAVWLLENGAQASVVLPDGSTLLERASRTDQIDLRETYAELLIRHGAGEKPKLEQAAPRR